MEELLTTRLRLRFLNNEDAQDLYNLRCNEEVGKYIDRDKPKDRNEVLSFIKDRIDDVSEGKIMFWAITEFNNDKLIGTICLWNFNKENTTAEVGYELHPDHQNKGIMSEALKEVLNYGFQTLQLEAIEAFTNKDNEASTNLLKKNSFVHDDSRIDSDFPNNLIFIKHA